MRRSRLHSRRNLFKFKAPRETHFFPFAAVVVVNGVMLWAPWGLLGYEFMNVYRDNEAIITIIMHASAETYWSKAIVIFGYKFMHFWLYHSCGACFLPTKYFLCCRIDLLLRTSRKCFMFNMTNVNAVLMLLKAWICSCCQVNLQSDYRKCMQMTTQ